MTIFNSTISFSNRPVLISDRLEGCVCGCLSPASTVTIIGLTTALTLILLKISEVQWEKPSHC